MFLDSMFHRACCCVFGSLFLATLTESEHALDVQNTQVWGPGLKSDPVLPVRYFFIQAVSTYDNNITKSIGNPGFSVTLTSPSKSRVRVYTDILDRRDGLYIVRYRLLETEINLKLSVTYKGHHVSDSPYVLPGPLYPESCYCPEPSLDKWLDYMACPQSYQQIDHDLAPFRDIDLEYTAQEVQRRYNDSTAHGLCHYKILNNQVQLPDIEFFMNLGDWEGMLEDKSKVDPVPIFSWCGSDDSFDIVMPTYDIAMSTLKMQESWDVFSVMGNSPTPWENKTESGFWRGRDSRQERLDFVAMAKEQPDLIDAKFARMLRFDHDVDKYGDIVDNVPFYDFFKHKYQINVDGAVAAYRFPYLLAGDSVVLKQDSKYYEHFYKELKPYVHYVPFKREFSDLLETIQWLKDNDEKAKEISQNGRNYVFNRLTPSHIYCYHVKLLQEYSSRVNYPPSTPDDSWELIGQLEPLSTCTCDRRVKKIKEKKYEL